MSAAPVNTNYRRDLHYVLARDIYTTDSRNVMDASTAFLRRMAAVFEMYRIEIEYQRGGS